MLARVLIKSVRQGSYLLEGPQYATRDATAAKVAAGLDAVSQTQFTCSAEETDCGVSLEGKAECLLHKSFPSIPGPLHHQCKFPPKHPNRITTPGTSRS